MKKKKKKIDGREKQEKVLYTPTGANFMTHTRAL